MRKRVAQAIHGRAFLGICAAMGLFACGGVSPPRALDITPPRIVAVSLQNGSVIDPGDSITVRFTEAMDEPSFDGSIMVVPFGDGGRCSSSGSCIAPDVCLAGVCQRFPLDKGWKEDLSKHPLNQAHIKQLVPTDLVVGEGLDNVVVRPHLPLKPSWHYVLMLSSAVSDAHANTLAQGPGLEGLAADPIIFETVDAETMRPQARLAAPPPGSLQRPVNLSRVIVRASRSLTGGDRPSAFGLTAFGKPGTLVALESLGVAPCPEDATGANGSSEVCYRLRAAGTLPQDAELHLTVNPEVTDARGGPAYVPGDQWFSTGHLLEEGSPDLAQLKALFDGGCVVVRAESNRETDLVVQLAGDVGQCEGGTNLQACTRASYQARTHVIAIPLVDGGIGEVTVSATNEFGASGGVWRFGGARQHLVSIVISEIMANPNGPEPAQEWVELYNASEESVDLAGWSLDDGDDGVGVNILPTTALSPRQFALVVGPGFRAEDLPTLNSSAGALLVRLPTKLGQNGLSNQGESIVLRDGSGALISSYSAEGSAAKNLSEGQSIERVPLVGCDIAANWRPNAAKSSTPGRAPDVP